MTQRELELLKDLYLRLVQNYNDNIPFEQTEEDRIVLANLIEDLEDSSK